jgi:4,5-dihydroxyphthalate decarboxylase
MGRISLSLACGDYEITRPIIEGVVEIEGADVTVLTGDKERIFRPDRRAECDVAEFNLIQYLKAREAGAAITAVPVFLHRRFRHGSIFVSEESRIHEAAQLAGRRVGVGGFEPAAVIWIKGILQDQYGVAADDVDWVDVFGLLGRLPDGWDAPADKADPMSRFLIDEELLAGRLDAMASAYLPKAFLGGDPRIRRLFADYEEEERSYFRQFGVFPIMHLLTVDSELVERHPWLPASLSSAFARAQRIALARLRDPRVLPLAFAFKAFEDQSALMGDNPWQVGLTEGNARAIDAAVRYAFEQGITTTRPEARDLFCTLEVPNDGSASFI